MVFIIYLFIIFQYYTGSAIAYVFNLNESMVLRVIAFFGVLFSFLELFKCFNKFSHSQKACVCHLLAIYCVIGISLVITYFINDLTNTLMKSYLLSFFSITLTGMVLGVCGFKRIKPHRFGTSLFIFSTLLTIPLIISTIQDSGISLAYQTGIDGQTLSYASSCVIVLLIFLLNNRLPISNNKTTNTIGRIICFFLIGFNVFVLLSGGGRGAFLTIMIVLFIYLIKIIKYQDIRGLLLLASVIVIGFVLINALERIINISSGISKIYLLFGNVEADLSASERLFLYRRALDISSNRYFIGAGAGSTTYDLGFYSHNILMDVLLDFGVFGLFIFIIIIVYLFIRFFQDKNRGIDVKFFALLLLTSLTSLMFSKAWLTDCQFWYSISGLCVYLLTKNKIVAMEPTKMS